ncbi:hypothetical protein OF83DRAFT_916428 [Amylostereum chailletii]|nr:hypothetical protein OF83DRAFT_916428 [Amylostereum chailletii]
MTRYIVSRLQWICRHCAESGTHPRRLRQQHPQVLRNQLAKHGIHRRDLVRAVGRHRVLEMGRGEVVQAAVDRPGLVVVPQRRVLGGELGPSRAEADDEGQHVRKVDLWAAFFGEGVGVGGDALAD